MLTGVYRRKACLHGPDWPYQGQVVRLERVVQAIPRESKAEAEAEAAVEEVRSDSHMPRTPQRQVATGENDNITTTHQEGTSPDSGSWTLGRVLARYVDAPPQVLMRQTGHHSLGSSSWAVEAMAN